MKSRARNISLKLSLITLILLAGCQDVGHGPTRTYLPDGYTGWVRVEYSVASAPPLPYDWRLQAPMRWRREVISASGLFQTSTVFAWANGTREYYFHSGLKVPEQLVSCEFSFRNSSFRNPNSQDKEFFMFFVGPPEESKKRCDELRKYQTSENASYKFDSLADLPSVGNLNSAQPKYRERNERAKPFKNEWLHAN